jgi:hypothetical protein
MEAKEAAEKITENIRKYDVEFSNCKKSVENLLKMVMLDTRNTMQGIPDKETFLKVIAALGDNALDFTKIVKGLAGELLEKVDEAAIYQAEKLIDRYILSSVLGPEWYQDLVNWITTIELETNK